MDIIRNGALKTYRHRSSATETAFEQYAQWRLANPQYSVPFPPIVVPSEITYARIQNATVTGLFSNIIASIPADDTLLYLDFEYDGLDWQAIYGYGAQETIEVFYSF